MTISADDLDRRNRATWAEVVDEYTALDTWTDAGERVAVAMVSPHVRGLPVLDVGAGVGRSASFLRLLTDDYVAVDHTPEMVAAFRRSHPDLEVHEADARDLGRFEAGRFGLVVFSYNGIDGLPHADRAVVLAELRRVARPDGWVLYSTHNLAGPSFGEVPWRGSIRSGPRPARLARSLLAAVRGRRHHVRRWRGWWAGRAAAESGAGWAVRVSAAHHFGVVMHYSSAAAVLAEARRAGLVDPVLLDSERGAPVDPAADLSSVRWFQVLARAS